MNVQVGDVIYIEASSGAVKRVGRCDVHATEFDLEAEEYVPLPKVQRPSIRCSVVRAQTMIKTRHLAWDMQPAWAHWSGNNLQITHGRMTSNFDLLIRS